MSANLQLAPQQTQKFQIRLLGADDLAHFEAHMLRLSDACRRLRFGTHVSDAFLRGYAQRVDLRNTAVLGVFVDGEMRGAAELRSFAVTWGHDAEGAFTVEKQYRACGMGKAMMAALVDCGRKLGVCEIHLALHAANHAMHKLAAAFAASMHCDGCELLARIKLRQEDLPTLDGQSDGTSALVFDLE
jgi:GNAT superfamily N-acetyltransferase